MHSFSRFSLCNIPSCILCTVCYNTITEQATTGYATRYKSTHHTKKGHHTMTHEQLTAVIIRYKENAQLAEAIEAEQAEIREQLKLELADRNTTCLDVGVHRVKLAEFTRTMLDSKAVKTLNPALFDQCSKTSTVKRLTVN